MMSRRDIQAYNAGIKDLASIAQASADAFRARLVEKPTRFAYAIKALDAIVEAATALTLPDNAEVADADA